MQTVTVNTKSRLQAVDVTGEIEQVVRRSGVSDGVCLLTIPHTTAGIFLNERDDPAVATDIMEKLDELVPRTGRYKHAEGNSDSHIKAVLAGSAVEVPISGGWLVLGRWQGIFLAEFDGPRTRTLNVTILKA